MHFKLSHRSATIFALALLAGFAGLAVSMERPVISAASRGNVEVTFTKWVTDYPNMAGVVGGDLGSGSFAGEVISRNPNIANGRITKIEALYQVRGGGASFNANLPGGANSFDALVEVWQQPEKGKAVFNGIIVDGWMEGERVTGRFTHISCREAASGVCFQGTIRVMLPAVQVALD